MKKANLGLIIFLVTLIITACGNENKVETTANGNNTKSVTFTITEMDCSSCPFVVKSSLERVKGVKTVEVTITEGVQGTAKVVFDASKTDVKTLKNTVLELEYGVKQ
ncbi:heavy-metal-associated domain-containing protein [Parageobacillus toebii]|uniref:heavy-metal-associated domain-containing protein n=1 Tax=Parageobacillus toebii TaxID=153151 RepID=UPI0007896F4F|nr:cation transporter [Parageobacillus toebii]